MKRLAIVVLVLVAAACGGKKDNGAAADSACAAAAHAASSGLTANAPDAQKALLGEKASQLEAVIAKHCNEDKWPEDVIACYRDASGMMAMKACRSKLPKDQGDKLLADEIGVMSAGMGGGGGMAPHAMPPANPPANP
jgi:hypothetical protein